MTEIQRTNVDIEETDIDKRVNIMGQFIAEGGFDKAFQAEFGLPEAVVKSMGEVS